MLPFGQVLRRLRSAHLLSDFYPFGTWSTSTIVSLKAPGDARTQKMIMGPGWADDEIPPLTTAAHDLAMGLICFDQVLVPLECIGRVFNLVGESRLTALVYDEVLQFVHWEGFDSVLFESDNAGFGTLVTGIISEIDPHHVIKCQSSPVPGREAEAAALSSRIEQKVIRVDLSGGLNFADVCNGLFVSPATRAILGIGEGTPAGRIPRWAAHPALRVVQIARIGATCQKLGLGSMKLMTGAAKAAEIAFSAIAQGVLSAEPGSYTLSGKFGIIGEEEFRAQPGIWDSILRFREGAAGVDLRREVLRRLANNEGAEIVPAINSSLNEMIGTAVLARARTEMSGLLVANGVNRVVPAVWSDSAFLQNGPEIWRRRTKQRFTAYLAEHGIGAYDLCPCGSFEKVKFCCMASLES